MDSKVYLDAFKGLYPRTDEGRERIRYSGKTRSEWKKKKEMGRTQALLCPFFGCGSKQTHTTREGKERMYLKSLERRFGKIHGWGGRGVVLVASPAGGLAPLARPAMKPLSQIGRGGFISKTKEEKQISENVRSRGGIESRGGRLTTKTKGGKRTHLAITQVFLWQQPHTGRVCLTY